MKREEEKKARSNDEAESPKGEEGYKLEEEKHEGKP